MSLGKVSSGDFRNGTPIILPHQFGNPVTNPEPFGNVIPQSNPTMDSNPVTWVPSPTHFGNQTGFSLQAVPPIVIVPQNSSETFIIPVTLLGGFAGEVTFTYFGAPIDLALSLAPNPTDTQSTVIVTVGAAVPTGKYTVTIVGTSGTEVEFVFAHVINVIAGVPSLDFLLQEDGISLFELEDGSGFILLEV